MAVATCLFAATALAQTYVVLKAFSSSDSAHPWARLIQGTDGNLYGTTAGGGYGGDPTDYGTIFKIAANGSIFTTLHRFAGSDGAYPQAGLIQGTDGSLYGTTPYGGTGNCNLGCGMIFKIDTSGSTFTTLHNFTGSDGSNPYAGLTRGTDGNLYGTTKNGGAGSFGTIFKIDTSSSALTTLHSFTGSDGVNPQAGLIQGTDGNLYGTTINYGLATFGTIFRIDTSGSALTTLHSFTGSDGSDPENAGLIQGSDGNLYGTTYDGGPGNCYLGCGTIFKIGTNGSAFTTLHSFAGYDSQGAKPNGGVIQGTDGNLYGTTAQGGACGIPGCGTIFKIDTSGSALTTLHTFTISDGASPFAGLTRGTDGNLYGTTVNGGANGGGVAFKITTTRAPVIALSVLPVVGSTPGANGTFFKTSVQLHNRGSAPIAGQIVFHASGTSGSNSDPALPYSLVPGQTQSITDLLPAMGRSGLGSADIEVTSGSSPVATARVFNDAGAAGTTGFTEEAIRPEEALSAGARGVLLLPPDLTAFRFNLGVRTLELGASIALTLRDAAGGVVATVPRVFPATYHLQQTATDFLTGVTPPPGGSITVEIVSGSAIVYGATVDNITGDPSLQIARAAP